MKNISTIFFILLFFDYSFCIGGRHEPLEKVYTIQKLDSFSNIKGWGKMDGDKFDFKKNNGKWYSRNNYIQKSKRGYSLDFLQSYEILELPHLRILTVHYRDGYYLYPDVKQEWRDSYKIDIFIFNKNELINDIDFLDEKFDEIKINTYNETYTTMVPNFVKNEVYFKDKIKETLLNFILFNENNFEDYNKLFYLHYFKYSIGGIDPLKIQFFISKKDSLFKILNQISNEDLISDVKELFNDRYFESSFLQFQSFFNSLTD